MIVDIFFQILSHREVLNFRHLIHEKLANVLTDKKFFMKMGIKQQ